jgi:hypothetical protein
MPRKKPTNAPEASSKPTQVTETAQAASVADPSAEQPEPTAPKNKWLPRFGIFTDVQAGVHLVEDRANKRMTIQFTDKPSDAVRAVIKGEPYLYRYDGEEKLWYKPIKQAAAAASRAEADELAATVARMIRSEKGLEQLTPYKGR